MFKHKDPTFWFKGPRQEGGITETIISRILMLKWPFGPLNVPGRVPKLPMVSDFGSQEGMGEWILLVVQGHGVQAFKGPL